MSEGSLSPLVAVSIVNWRSADLTIACLESLVSQVGSDGRCQVYVVDNDSGDGSAERIETAIVTLGWKGWATLLRAPGNNGFASGNNFAIRHALSVTPMTEYFLLLNPDTIARPSALGLLLDFMVANPKAGIAGGRSEDPDTTPQCCCFRFPGLVDEVSSYLRFGLFDRLFRHSISRIGIPESTSRVDWVSGAFMLVRRAVVDQVLLMDEGYFLYFEETDFTLRASRAGWECWHVPESRVVHLVGQSSGVNVRHQRPKRLPRYWFESRRRYFTLNHGRAYAVIADVCVIVAHLAWQLRRILQRRENIDPPKFLGDFLRHGSILNGRGSLTPRKISL